MQLSRQADYGVRVMLHVAASQNGPRVTARQAARRQLVPVPFMRKIVSRLASAGLLRSSRGRGGGMVLSRPAKQISLLDVIEALEGPIFLNRCLVRPGYCPLDRICAAQLVWKECQALILGHLRAANLEELAARTQTLHLQRQKVPSLSRQLGG